MDQIKIETLGLTELAQILKKSRRTLQNDLTRAPDRLPPQVRRVGRQPLWLVDDVKNWLQQPNSTPLEIKEKPRRGRPRKALKFARGGTI
jgi:hypothetical protein